MSEIERQKMEMDFRVLEQQVAAEGAEYADLEVLFLIKELDALFDERRDYPADRSEERDFRIRFLFERLKETYLSEVANEDTCVFA